MQLIFTLAALTAVLGSPAGLIYQSSPLLARISPSPEAPASTVHATHVAALSPIAFETPVAYSAPGLSFSAPYTYDSGFAVSC